MIRCRDIVHGKLAGHVGLFVDGVGKLAKPLDAVVLEAVSHVTLGKQVRVKVGRGLGSGTQAEAINEVLRDKGVYRSDVHQIGFVLRSGCLHIVFDEGFGQEEEEIEVLHLLHVMYQAAEVALRLGQLH